MKFPIVNSVEKIHYALLDIYKEPFERVKWNWANREKTYIMCVTTYKGNHRYYFVTRLELLNTWTNLNNLSSHINSCNHMVCLHSSVKCFTNICNKSIKLINYKVKSTGKPRRNSKSGFIHLKTWMPTWISFDNNYVLLIPDLLYSYEDKSIS